MRYKVVDLFAGAGGLSYGFAHDDDFEIVAANEISEPAAKTYATNHPTTKVYNKDIKDFSIKDLVNDFGIKKGDIDVIAGGPPCQAYSTAGKRLIDDPRGKLFQEYYRILKEFCPKVFIYENVKGLMSMGNGELIETIISLFESLGYNVQMKVLNAADYGTPQKRERVIIVGTLNNYEFKYPQPTHYEIKQNRPKDLFLKPYVTLGDALGDLPIVKSGESGTKYLSKPQNEYQRLMRQNAPNEILDHTAVNHRDHLIAMMEALPDGGSRKDIPIELRPLSGFDTTYCKLWWNRPSLTITSYFRSVGSGRFIHPRDSRTLTIREAARLQGFPDDYVFCGSDTQKTLHIGNAVPTFLSVAIKNSVKESLKKK